MSEVAQGPVVLITGAAGGLGTGLVRAFRDAGWRVAAGYHVRPLASEDDRVWPLALNVVKPGEPERVVEVVVTRWGRLDALVNNAGVVADAVLPQLAEVDWDRVLAVNLKGAMACARAAARPMSRQGAGHIVNIGSHAGRVGARGQAAYAAAKAGLIGFTQSLAAELADRNVRVNAVLPGVLPTAMTAGLAREALDRLVAANLLCRLNSVAEVARFIVFLAGMENVSAQIFQLDSRPARWL
jgi:3-oxoacyl-[acyl-carrier protein] reductase